MKKTVRLYYIVTILLSVFVLFGAVFDAAAAPGARAIVVHLGYPVYVLYIVGWAKFFGLVGIWQYKIPVLCEWAYAGLMIDVGGTLVSSIAVGDGPLRYGGAIFGVALVALSYGLFKKVHTT